MFLLQIAFQPTSDDEEYVSSVAKAAKANQRRAGANQEIKDAPKSSSGSSVGDFFYSSTKGLLKGSIEIAVPTLVAAHHSKDLTAIANTWRSLSKATSTTEALKIKAPITGQVLGKTFFGRMATCLSRRPVFAKTVIGVTQLSTKVFSWIAKLPGIHHLAKLAGPVGTTAGRVMPGVGLVVAVGDCVKDIYKATTMEKNEGESDEDYEKRCGVAKSDATINCSCTAAGAAIGAVIGSVIPVAGTALGAIIGAGIGNLVGSLSKSDGWGRPIAKGIGYAVGGTVKFLGHLLGF